MNEQTNGDRKIDVQRGVLPKQSEGPWSVKEVPGADGHLSVVDSKGLFVARVHRRGEVVTAEARVNANIIAAAPDLLDMVRRLARELAVLGKGRPSIDRLVDEACALGNKAEGRS
ncbi:MAG: hypothetical protein DI536_04370 [Archangium gephyra]|uniref:Uncharacterized protein n=1 Tax=Archangium gephyra TaxID=48 RepID=A0A2W5U1Y2_9BACT|nr:MAG: hypothetical protein DI536_04370 [Archangium gephyra]